MMRTTENALRLYLHNQGHNIIDCEFCEHCDATGRRWTCTNQKTEPTLRKRGKTVIVNPGDYCSFWESVR